MIAIIIGAIGLMIAFLLQRKKYQISYIKMIVIYVIFTLSGAVGSKIGSFISEGNFSGMRLYGLILFNIPVVIAVARLLKMEAGALGDYVAVPTMVGCAAAKLECLRSNCCYGCVLYTNELGVEFRFPSKWVEIFMWLAMTGWLLLLEKKNRANMLRWPLTVIWFGLLRFTADLFRGSFKERQPFLLGLPAGQFWSLVLVAIGAFMLYCYFRKYRGYKPTVRELLRTAVGMEL